MDSKSYDAYTTGIIRIRGAINELGRGADVQNVTCQPSFDTGGPEPKLARWIPGLRWLCFPSIVLDVRFSTEANAFSCRILFVKKGSNCVADRDKGWLLEFPNS
jgi:hypothetical protein